MKLYKKMSGYLFAVLLALNVTAPVCAQVVSPGALAHKQVAQEKANGASSKKQNAKKLNYSQRARKAMIRAKEALLAANKVVVGVAVAAAGAMTAYALSREKKEKKFGGLDGKGVAGNQNNGNNGQEPVGYGDLSDNDEDIKEGASNVQVPDVFQLVRGIDHTWAFGLADINLCQELVLTQSSVAQRQLQWFAREKIEEFDSSKAIRLDVPADISNWAQKEYGKKVNAFWIVSDSGKQVSLGYDGSVPEGRWVMYLSPLNADQSCADYGQGFFDDSDEKENAAAVQKPAFKRVDKPRILRRIFDQSGDVVVGADINDNDSEEEPEDHTGVVPVDSRAPVTPEGDSDMEEQSGAFVAGSDNGDKEEEEVKARAAQTSGAVIKAKDLFEHVTGYDPVQGFSAEELFRNDLEWDSSKGYLAEPIRVCEKRGISFDQWKEEWVAQDPRRAAIFEGAFTAETLGELAKRVDEKVAGVPTPGSFNIILYNPAHSEKAEITRLQTDPNNADAAFQVASTEYGLEGAAASLNGTLTHTLNSVVQGEWASWSALPAEIYRKYFLPTKRMMAGEWGDLRYNSLAIFNETRKLEGILILTHKDVPVVGHVETFAPKQEGKSPTYQPNADFRLVNNGQRITQIFNCAVSLRKYGTSVEVPRDEQMRAINVMRAMYRGAILKTADLGKKKLFLTLLGGGAFQNDISWIGAAVTQPSLMGLIKESGIEVNLLYRPDSVRAGFYNGLTHYQIRDSKKDKEFLRQMYAAKQHIEGGDLVNCDANPEVQCAFGMIEQAYTDKTGKQVVAPDKRLLEICNTGKKADKKDVL